MAASPLAHRALNAAQGALKTDGVHPVIQQRNHAAQAVFGADVAVYDTGPAARGLLEACGFAPAEIGTPAMQQLPARIKAKGEKALCESLGIGLPTLQDIAAELCRPGRDVRGSLPKPLLRSDVMGMEDLTPGMELVGTVRNVIDFGAFVDIGVHQDGLVHISQIADRFVKHPRDLLKVGQRVRVKVLEVNPAKKRIALSMKGVPQEYPL